MQSPTEQPVFRAGGNRKRPPAIHVELVTYLNDDPVVHRYAAVPEVNVAKVHRLVTAERSGSATSFSEITGLVAGVLSDRDGLVPSTWEPRQLTAEEGLAADAPELVAARKAAAALADAGLPTADADARVAELVAAQDEPAPAEPMYLGPDGARYPASDQASAEKFADQSNWSSRRRFLHLMNVAEDHLVLVNDLAALAHHLIGLSAERPTRP